MKRFYIWEDLNDPYTSGPDLKEDTFYSSKRAAKADFKEYVRIGGFNWEPTFKLYLITVEAL